MFDRGAEILPGVTYRIGLQFKNEANCSEEFAAASTGKMCVETVWGGRGQNQFNQIKYLEDGDSRTFHFSKLNDFAFRSSVSSAQIPQLYFV